MTTHKAEILIVEDESMVAVGLKRSLEAFGYTVTGTARDADEAVESARAQKPDLVLMDIRLSGPLDGFAAAERIQNHQDIPVVYLSAAADELKLRNSKAAAFGYLLKPVAEHELRNVIEISLYRHKMEKKIRESEQWLSAILRCISEAVIVTDRQGNIEFLNPLAEQLLSISKSEVIGRPYSEVYQISDEEGTPLDKTAVDSALEFGDLCTSGKKIFLRQSWLARIPIEDTAAPLIGSQGETNGVVLVFRDISEHQKATEQLRSSEEKLRSLVESAPDNICLINRNGEIQFINRPLPGYRATDMLNKTLQSFFEDSEQQIINRTIEKVFTKKQMGMFEASQRASGGERIWYSARAMPVLGTGSEDNAMIIIRDTTDRKRAEQRLAESEERFALAAAGANDGLWDMDLIRNKVYYSERWKEMLGCSDDDIANSLDEWFDRVHPEDLKKLNTEIEAHLEGQKQHFRCEYRLLHKNGEYLWMLARGVAVRDKDGRPYRMAGSQADITRRKLYEEQLVHDAFHDALTGLPNRNLFIDHLEGAINRYKRNKKYMFAVLFMDLDRFKIINDSLGHLAGDRMLIEIANRLLKNLRKGDTIARFGGDEFTILLEGINKLGEVTKIADKLQRDISKPVNLDEGQEVYTSASIGIATSLSEYSSPEELLRDADTAMYKAKAKGKGTHVIFNIDMHTRAKKELRLERDLRSAINREEFELYYQPIIEIESRSLVGLEALIRWNHPNRGVITPLHFIPFAEETGMIFKIGEWVLDKAARQRKVWAAQGHDDFYVGVNISALRFHDEDIHTLIAKTLKTTGIDPALLQLEITEGKIMRDAEDTIVTLHALKDLGVKLSIDDFGTGYSSLAYLKRFPLSAIKIDRTFIKDVDTRENDAAITKAIIAMAQNLQLKVIAEGVENEHQLEFLRDAGCNYVQGFYFARPQPADEIQSYLENPEKKVG